MIIVMRVVRWCPFVDWRFRAVYRRLSGVEVGSCFYFTLTRFGLGEACALPLLGCSFPFVCVCWFVCVWQCVLAGLMCGWVFALCPGRHVSAFFLPPGMGEHVWP